MKKILFVFCILFVILGVASYSLPRLITVQGKLTRNNNPITGVQGLTVHIVEKGETDLNRGVYADLFTVDLGTNGIFSIELGNGSNKTPISSTTDFSKNYDVVVGVSDGNGGIVSFRQGLTTVPYSFHSENSDKLGGYSVTQFVTKDAQGNVYGVTISGGITTQEADGRYVKKTGDKMTGVLSVETNINNAAISTWQYAAKGKMVATTDPTRTIEGYLGYVLPTGYQFYGVYGKSVKNSDSSNSARYGVYGEGDAVGVGGRSWTGNGIYGATDSGYSGYFYGGKGVKIVGSLEVTGTISSSAISNIAGNFVKKSGDEMDGQLKIKTTGAAISEGLVVESAGVLIAGTGVTGKGSGILGGVGVLGQGNSAGMGVGVKGEGIGSIEGIGVWGIGSTYAGSFESSNGYGVIARAKSGDKGGVLGSYGNTLITDAKYGVAGVSDAGSGVYGEVKGSISSDWKAGVYGKGGSGTHGVMGYTTSESKAGVRGINPNGIGIYGSTGINSYGVKGSASITGTGVFGENTNTTNPAGDGVVGHSTRGRGVYGYSTSGYGVKGSSTTSYGVYGSSGGSNAGIYAENTGSGPALEVGTGGILVSEVFVKTTNGSFPYASITSNGEIETIDSPAGKIFLGGGVSTGTIKNKYVKQDSLVFLQSSSGNVKSYTSLSTYNGSFTFYHSQSGGATIYFFVVNPK